MDYRWDQMVAEATDVASCYVVGYGAYAVMADHLIDKQIDMATFTMQVYELRSAVGARLEALDKQSLEQLEDVIREQLAELAFPDAPSKTVLFVSDENADDRPRD